MQGRRGLRMLQERGRDLRKRRECRHQRRMRHRARRHLHQPPRLTRLEPQHHPSVRQPPRMQRQPPPRPGRHRDRRLNLGLDPLARQRLPHLLALPAQIGLRCPVLQRAPAAVAVVWRHRCNPLGAGLQHLDRLGPAVLHIGPHQFARQGQGREHRPGGRFRHPVSLSGNTRDPEGLGHPALLERDPEKCQRFSDEITFQHRALRRREHERT